MNRDMDLVRDNLLRVEADPKMDRDNVGTLKIEHFPGRTHQEMSFHLTILIEVGLIAAPSRGLSRPLVVSGLTWTGCELLDDIRDPEVWKKTKEGAKAVGSFSLDTLRALAKGFIRKQAERLTGIDIDLFGIPSSIRPSPLPLVRLRLHIPRFTGRAAQAERHVRYREVNM